MGGNNDDNDDDNVDEELERDTLDKTSLVAWVPTVGPVEWVPADVFDMVRFDGLINGLNGWCDPMDGWNGMVLVVCCVGNILFWRRGK